MAAADGLIVRLRPTGGILPAATARAIADLAARFGNGKLDLTARANLQMRGMREASMPALVDALRSLGLVDCDVAAEAVRNVVASPLAGLHDGPDIRPLVAALEARLVGVTALHALPTKFGFLIDDGSVPSLADVTADVRFDWRGDAFAIGLGGTRDDAIELGACRADELVACAEEIARAALALFARLPDATRMRALIESLELTGESADLLLPLAGEGGLAKRGRMRGGATSLPIPAEAASRLASGDPPASGRRDATLTLAAPYGRLEAAMLHVAAALAARAGGELRLTPWRSLLLPGLTPDDAAARQKARAAGFIADPDDPRLRVAACVGAPECARATTATRADADALAAFAAALGTRGQSLHVSGCAKGCARAAAARATLVGRDGRYDLVVDGRAGDPPKLRGLDLAAARAALAELAA
jgi:precorrin-3B synthase